MLCLPEVMATEEKGQKMERGQTLGRELRQMTRPDSELSSVSSLVDLRTRGVIVQSHS